MGELGPHERVILKLEIVEETMEYGGPRFEIRAVYGDADAWKIAGLLAELARSLPPTDAKLIRPDRWPHKALEPADGH